MIEEAFSTLFVELDALMDSRAATLFRLSPEIFNSVIKNNYFERQSDFFEGVNLEDYTKLYNSRDRETLRNIAITDIGRLVFDFCKTTFENIVKSPFHFRPKVIVNIYPYVLEEEEINLIIVSIRDITRNIADIEVVNMSYEEITPVFVKSKLSTMVLYEYYQWLEIHSLNGNLKKTSCPDVTLLGPMIYFKPIDKEPDPNINPYKAMEQLAAPFISLNLIPIRHFSISPFYLKRDESEQKE